MVDDVIGTSNNFMSTDKEKPLGKLMEPLNF